MKSGSEFCPRIGANDREGGLLPTKHTKEMKSESEGEGECVAPALGAPFSASTSRPSADSGTTVEPGSHTLQSFKDFIPHAGRKFLRELEIHLCNDPRGLNGDIMENFSGVV